MNTEHHQEGITRRDLIARLSALGLTAPIGLTDKTTPSPPDKQGQEPQFVNLEDIIKNPLDYLDRPVSTEGYLTWNNGLVDFIEIQDDSGEKYRILYNLEAFTINTNSNSTGSSLNAFIFYFSGFRPSQFEGLSEYSLISKKSLVRGNIASYVIDDQHPITIALQITSIEKQGEPQEPRFYFV